jgi:hypothetical protein
VDKGLFMLVRCAAADSAVDVVGSIPGEVHVLTRALSMLTETVLLRVLTADV